MGFLDDLLGNVDKAIEKMETAAKKVESASDGVSTRLEKIADVPGKALQKAEAKKDQVEQTVENTRRAATGTADV